MTIEEIKAFLEENKDDVEVKAFLVEMSPKHETSAAEVQEFIKTDDGKIIVQPLIDQAVTKAVKTRDKAHEAILDTEVRKRVATEVLKMNPTEEPWQKEIRELREDNEKQKKQNEQDKLKRVIVEKAAKLTVDPFFLEHFTPESEEVGELFLKQIKDHDDAIATRITNELMAGGYKPKLGDEKDTKKINLSALSMEEAIAAEMSGELDKQLIR